MKSAFLAGVIACLVCVLVATPAVRAQGVGASGTINGTVVDPTGAVVPKALLGAALKFMPGKNADASVGSLTSAWQYCIASCALAIWAPELTLWMSNTVGSPVSTVR